MRQAPSSSFEQRHRVVLAPVADAPHLTDGAIRRRALTTSPPQTHALSATAAARLIACRACYGRIGCDLAGFQCWRWRGPGLRASPPTPDSPRSAPAAPAESDEPPLTVSVAWSCAEALVVRRSARPQKNYCTSGRRTPDAAIAWMWPSPSAGRLRPEPKPAASTDRDHVGRQQRHAAAGWQPVRVPACARQAQDRSAAELVEIAGCRSAGGRELLDHRGWRLASWLVGAHIGRGINRRRMPATAQRLK